MTTATTTAAADEALTLADDSNLVGPKVFGELVARAQGRVDDDGNPKPYTAESVRNWERAGRVSAAGEDKRGKLYDPRHAKAVAANVSMPTRGGARRNSGRKKTKTTLASTGGLGERMDTAQKARDAIADFEQREETGEKIRAEDAVNVTELIGLKREELNAVIAAFGTGKNSISPAAVGLVNSLIDSKIKDQKLAAMNGELVEKAVVVEAIAKANGPVVEMLESLPRTLVDRLSSLCWINEGVVDTLIAGLFNALTTAGVDTDEPLIHNALNHIRETLTRPAALDSTLRVVINGEIDGAKLGLVKTIEGKK